MKRGRICLVMMLLFLAALSTPAHSQSQNGLPIKCYDSWDDPSYWRDDYNARRCTPCDYVRGHDFDNEAECSPSTTSIF